MYLYEDRGRNRVTPIEAHERHTEVGKRRRRRQTEIETETPRCRVRGSDKITV